MNVSPPRARCMAAELPEGKSTPHPDLAGDFRSHGIQLVTTRARRGPEEARRELIRQPPEESPKALNGRCDVSVFK